MGEVGWRGGGGGGKELYCQFLDFYVPSTSLDQMRMTHKKTQKKQSTS